MRRIAVMNQKGGVGKTTTAFNLSHALALRGMRVLALDLDPQGHLSASFGVEPAGAPAMDDVLLDGVSMGEAMREVRPGLWLVPAGDRLADVDQLREGGAHRGWLLDEALAAVDSPEVVLMDCPPSSAILTTNALFAANELLIPVAGEYLSLHGLGRMLRIVKYAERRLKREVRKWLALTRFHTGRCLARDVRDCLLRYFPGQVLLTPIREAVALAESPSFGKTIFEYQGGGRGARDYDAMADDLLLGRTM